MKKLLCVFVLSALICACLFADWTLSNGYSTYIDAQETGQLTVGVPDIEKKVLSSEVKGPSGIILEIYVSSLKSTSLTEWDATGKNRVTLFPNAIKLYSSDKSIDYVFTVNNDYYYESKGYISFSSSDFVIYLFEGLCSGKDMTVELFSYAGESRTYSFKAGDSFAKFFEFLRMVY